MDRVCLLVNLGDDSLGETWHASMSTLDPCFKVQFADSRAAALNIIKGAEVVQLVLFAEEFTDDLQAILEAYRDTTGIPDFQAIVCDEPSPKFMALAFDQGIDQFLARANWPVEVAAMSRQIKDCLLEPNSAELATLVAAKVLSSKDQDQVLAVQANLAELATYDYRAAYLLGKASEAVEQMDAAITFFKTAARMNQMFRPSRTSLGEALLITGKIDDAIAVFQKLEATNPYNMETTAALAAAYIEKGEFDNAGKCLKAIERSSSDSRHKLELQGLELLKRRKFDELLALLPKMQEVSVYFASRVNQAGIQLTQAGNGKTAFSLYDAVHPIVPKDVQSKITINAALALRQMGEYKRAMAYLARCEQEYGGSFSRLQKIRDTISQEYANSSGNKGAKAAS